MQHRTGNESPLQPLPNNVQEKVWAFVRAEIRRREAAAGKRVAKFEIHVTDRGQIQVEVLSSETEEDARIDDGLEEAGLKDGEVNRIAEREEIQKPDVSEK